MGRSRLLLLGPPAAWWCPAGPELRWLGFPARPEGACMLEVMPSMFPAGCWDHWLAVRSIWDDEGRCMESSAWGAEPGRNTPERAGWLGVWQRPLLACPLRPCRKAMGSMMRVQYWPPGAVQAARNAEKASEMAAYTGTLPCELYQQGIAHAKLRGMQDWPTTSAAVCLHLLLLLAGQSAIPQACSKSTAEPTCC